MIENPKYNRFRDVSIVEPNLSINLDEALKTGVIKDIGTEVEYNGITDPTLIRTKVTDTFRAIDERNSVVHKELSRIKKESSDSSIGGFDGDLSE